MKCLGLDIGSTSIKGAVLDLERNQIGETVSQPFPAPLPGQPAGWFEVSPTAIEAAARQVLETLWQAAPSATGLFCSGQMGGVILVDDGGAALSNYLSWRDQRTQQPHGSTGTYLDTIRSRWTKDELAELGNELQAGSTASLLFWLNEQDLLPAGAMPATVADYVLGRLCPAPPTMHRTQALGLLDLRARLWHLPALAALGLEKVRWPQLAEERQPLGSWRQGGKQLVCFSSLGDQQCALKGVGLAGNELSLNISTGSQVSRLTGAFEPGPYQTRCYLDGAFLNTITHLPAGRSLNTLVELLTELARAQGQTLTNPWEFIAQSAAASDGGGLSVELAFFAGPLGTSGRVEGITTENLTIGNLFHAAFRSMAENYARCADRLGPNRTGMGLALSGGLTRSVPILRELIRAQFDLPIRESAAAEETLLGLMAIARATHAN